MSSDPRSTWEHERQAWEQQLPWSRSEPAGTDPSLTSPASGNAGRHAHTSRWGDDQPWDLDAAADDGRLTPTTGPVTDSGWYVNDVEPTDRTAWTTSWNAPAYDPLDDPATTQGGWNDDRTQVRPPARREDWTGEWDHHAIPAAAERTDHWPDAPGWDDQTRTDLRSGGLDPLSLPPAGGGPPGPPGPYVPGGDVTPGLSSLAMSRDQSPPVSGRQELTETSPRPGGAPPRPDTPPPGTLSGPPAAGRWGWLPAWAQLSASDLEVIRWWAFTRLAIVLVVVTAPSLFLSEGKVPAFLDRWKQWDFWHFDRIATHGYFAKGWETPVEAFFPGFPALLRVGHLIGAPTVVAGLFVSFVAGGIAAVALARLADSEWGEGAGRRAATMWMVAPPAIFLAAPYTESLFLGFAIPAWLAARRGHWWVAGLLAAGASSVRVSGVFLAVALVVEFLTSSKRRDWLSGLWLALPALPLLAYMAYLKANTGDWLRWYHAQADEWYRGFTLPHQAFLNTWNVATGRTTFGDVSAAVQANFEWMFRAELVALLLGVVLTGLLLWLRRWGEATWVGVQVAAFATSYWFFSVPRATLLWFPLWIGLAALSFRRQWVWLTYLLLSVPLFGVWAAAYATGKWSG